MLGGEHLPGPPDSGLHLVHQLALGLDKGGLVGAKEKTLVQHDGAGAFRCEFGQDFLHEQRLGGACLEGKVPLSIVAFLAPEGRIRQHVIELFIGKTIFGERVAQDDVIGILAKLDVPGKEMYSRM